MAPIIGIDLGTTNSLSSVFMAERPQLIPNAHGQYLTPSVVGLLENGEVVVGATAKELRVTHPDRCAWCFKRYMGSDRKLQLAGKSFSAIELSSLVLQSIKQDAEKFVGESVEEAVITVPAYFNDHQRQATRLAGKMAGWKVRRIVNEPTAAALVYGFHDREAERKLCVIDLGGGTFDVTMMEVFEGTLEIVATAGESMLGGEDFTDRLVATVLRHYKMQLETAEMRRPLQVARLRQECEQAKVKLGSDDRARVRFPDDQGRFADDGPVVTLKAETFSRVSESLMKRVAKPVEKALRDSGFEPSEIDDVILVGGATRMPVFQKFIEDYFGQPGLIEFNPDETVAMGAAVQAALIGNDAAVDDMVMTDVCPFTLGVEVCKDFAGQTVGGFFSPVIHRNTTIPVSREEVYATSSTNQPSVLLRIFQGESRKTKDNLELGQLEITGLPPGPAGMPVHVRFTYDLNGLLEVEAIVPESGRRFSTVLTQHVRELDEAGIEEAIERMQRLKFYPRDDLRNQRLLLYSERVVGEVASLQRQSLEEAIDAFEYGMASGDRELFASVRQGLLITLAQLGFHYDETIDEPHGDSQA